MDASIILGGQQLDLMGAMDRGREAAENKINLDRKNALNALIRDQGAGIMAGDPTALNALAGYDPQAALGIQSTVKQNAWAEEDRAAAKAEGKRMAEEALRANADKLTAEQLAAEQEALSKGLSGAAFFYQNGDQAGYNNFLAQQGMDPAEFSFEQFPAHAAMFEGALEAMGAFAPPKVEPLSPEGKFAQDKAAGLLPGDAAPQKTGDTFNLGGGSDKQIFDTLAASADRASTAAVGLNGLTEASNALEAGAITGFAADQRLYLAKLGNYLGVTDPSAVENTETFLAVIAPQVSAMIKATVGSANISNADREFAERAAAGTISLDEAAIKRMIKIMDKMGREAVRIHNEKVNRVYPEGQGYDRERALMIVAASGSGSPPQGSSAAPDQAEIDQLMLGP